MNEQQRPHGLRSTRLQSERGQAAIEFALTLTLTLMLVFGLIDFSRAIYAASVIQWAAQQGARNGIVNMETAVAAVKERMVGLDTEQATITVSQPETNVVQVDVAYEFEFVVPLISSITGESMTLEASASMLTY